MIEQGLGTGRVCCNMQRRVVCCSVLYLVYALELHAPCDCAVCLRGVLAV
jgi:hypothetical protein